MGEPTVEARSRLRALLSALLTDLPWTPARSRMSLFLATLLSGMIGGILHGLAMYELPAGGGGDAFLWNALECFGGIGAAIGFSVGLAMILSRSLPIRATLGAGLGVIFVAAAVFLIFHGDPVHSWGLFPHEDRDTLLYKPEGWGYYMGGPAAAMLVLTCHLARRCAGKVRLLLLVLVVGCFLVSRSQERFWRIWHGYHWPPVRCGNQLDGLEVPAWRGAVILTATLFAGCLLVDLAGRLLDRFGRAGFVRAGLLASMALFLGGLAWASRAMPLTPPSPVERITFSSDGQCLVTAHWGDTLRLWRVSEKGPGHAPLAEEIRKLRLHRGLVEEAPLFLSSSVYASCGPEGRLARWEVPSFRPLREIRIPGLDRSRPVISDDGSSLAATTASSEIQLWDLARFESDGRPAVQPLPSLSCEDSDAWRTVAFSPDNRWIAVSGLQSYSVLDRVNGLPVIGPRSRGEHCFRSVLAFSPDSNLLAVQSCSGYISLVEIPAGEIRHTLNYQGNYIHALAFSPDGRQLVAGYSEHLIVLEISSGEEHRIDLPSESDLNWIECLCYSPDGTRLAAGFRDGTVRIRRSPVLSADRR